MIKIAPETAIKLSCNDRIKHMVCEDIEDITPAQRMLSGALAGAVAQVLPVSRLCSQQSCTYGADRIFHAWNSFVQGHLENNQSSWTSSRAARLKAFLLAQVHFESYRRLAVAGL